MTIQQLQYILEVKRTGSVSQTAKNFFVSQSSVSNALSALESELGFPIFIRNWQGAVPTQRGLEVLEEASYICRHHQSILKKKELPGNRIRIITDFYLGFSEVFARLVEENRGRDDVSFSCESTNSGGMAMDRLDRFEADVFVGMEFLPVIGRLQQRSVARGLELKVRASVPAVARIGAGHPLYRRESLTPEDLKRDVIVDGAHGLLAKAKPVRACIGFDPERAILVSERQVRYDLITKGIGFGVGPQMPTALDQKYGFRSIPLPGLKYDVLSIVNPLRPVRPEVRRYLELLDGELADIKLPEEDGAGE